VVTRLRVRGGVGLEADPVPLEEVVEIIAMIAVTVIIGIDPGALLVKRGLPHRISAGNKRFFVFNCI